MNKKIKILIGCIAAALLVGVVATIIIVVPLSVHGARDARYQEALDLMDEAKNNNSIWDYEDALEILEEVKQQGLDVDDDILQCYYSMGTIALYDRENAFSNAIEYFKIVGNYKDAPELLKEAYYQQGFVHLKDGHYSWADDYFTNSLLDGYKNSDEMHRVAINLRSIYREYGQDACDAQLEEIDKYMK